MWKKLSYRQKNIVLMIAMVMIAYLSYVLSIKHTVTAFSLNRQLINEQKVDQGLEGSITQINSKNNFYVNVKKGFKVKKEDRENRLWQAVSGMAIEHNLDISLVPTVQLAMDTLTLQKGIVMQQFSFKGGYFNLVKLLDTVSKSSGIGEIADLKIAVPKEDKKTNQLTAQLTLAALAN